MEKFFASCLLLYLGLLTTLSLSAEIRIHPNCSGQARPCNLLASLTVPTVPHVTLTFMPGVHLLPSSISIQGKHHWKLNGIGKSTILCTGQRICDIDFSFSRNLKISNLTFAFSKLWFSTTSHIDIINSQFLNATSGAIKFTNSFNLKMDLCYFNNYYRRHSSNIIEFINVRGFGITRSEAKNTVDSTWYHSSTVWASNSTGYLGCSQFENNRDDSIIAINRCSSVYVSNCSFNSNSVNEGVYSSLQDKCDKSVIVSSTISNSYTRRKGIITTSTSPVILLASKFTNNRGSPIWSYNAIVDCAEFSVSIVSPIEVVRSNLDLCKWHIVGDAALCQNFSCKMADCSLPDVRISLEQSEYTVYEGIGRANRALQICAVARDLLIPIEASIHAHSGTAIENQDFIMTQPNCQPFKFLRKAGIQRKCTFIRIINDSVDENNEQFSVSLVADKPYIPDGIRRATVTIMETDTSVATPSTPTPTTISVTEDLIIENVNSPFYTAIVECGPLRRLVNYSTAGDNIENLKTAIVQSFGGLTGLNVSHIAILQVQSNLHGGYIDLISGAPAISNNSLIKVLTYDKFSCVPKISKTVISKEK